MKLQFGENWSVRKDTEKSREQLTRRRGNLWGFNWEAVCNLFSPRSSHHPLLIDQFNFCFYSCFDMALKPVKTSSSKNIVMFGPVGASVNVSDKYIWGDRMGEGGAELVQIFISFDSSRIYSLQFQYFENGKHVLSEKHGGNSGTNYHAIRFDYPKEYITSVIGSFKHAYDCNGITSITFVTNLSTYGPFGDSGSTSKTSTSFEFNLGNARRFCKFFGTSIDNHISSIGVYVDALGNPDIQQKQCGQSVEENQLELYSPY